MPTTQQILFKMQIDENQVNRGFSLECCSRLSKFKIAMSYILLFVLTVGLLVTILYPFITYDLKNDNCLLTEEETNYFMAEKHVNSFLFLGSTSNGGTTIYLYEGQSTVDYKTVFCSKTVHSNDNYDDIDAVIEIDGVINVIDERLEKLVADENFKAKEIIVYIGGLERMRFKC